MRRHTCCDLRDDGQVLQLLQLRTPHAAATRAGQQPTPSEMLSADVWLATTTTRYDRNMGMPKQQLHSSGKSR